MFTIFEMLCLHGRGLFPFAAVFIWFNAVGGSMLHYNSSSQELYLRCPGSPLKGTVKYASLWGRDDKMPLAVWKSEDPDNPEAKYDRLTVRRGSGPHVLEAVLHYVTCYDVTNYTCRMLVSYPFDQKTDNHTEAFTLEGEITEPVLKVQPIQARYKAGDAIQLTCSARIGWDSNSIVWETKLPGEKFSPVTGNCDQQTNITEQKTADSGLTACGVTSVSSMTHILSPDDDSREWRCRLKNTSQNAGFAVAVQRTNEKGCSELGRAEGQSTEVVSTEVVSAVTRKVSEVVQPSADHGGSGKSGSAKESAHMLLPLVAVICVLFVALVISMVGMSTVLRRQTKKQLSPLFFTPPPSDSAPYHAGPATQGVRTRSLPQLPSINLYALHEVDLSRRERDDDETPPKLFSPATSSVYVSMSAIPSLHEAPRGHLGQGGAGGVKAKPRDEAAAQYRRSESIYSNQDTEVTKVSSASAGSRDSHVTMGNLKGWI